MGNLLTFAPIEQRQCQPQGARVVQGTPTDQSVLKADSGNLDGIKGHGLRVRRRATLRDKMIVRFA